MPEVASTTLTPALDAGPLYGQIRSALRSGILDGRLPPGSRVPSESELGERFAASRITVRKALSELQREGLIYTLQGKGSFVTLPKAWQDVTSLRGFAEQMGAMGHEVVNQLLALEDEPASARVAERLAVPAGSPVTRLERLRFLDRAPLSLETTWVLPEIGRRLAQSDLESRDVFLIIENDCGVPLGHADLAVDAELADAPVASALRVPEGAPLLRIERLTHDRQGRALDYEFLRFRADIFQYRLRVDRLPTTGARA